MTDRQLLDQIGEKDQRAFEMLYKRYERLFYNWAFFRLNDRDAVCDILQNFWVAVWEQPANMHANEKGSVKDYMLRNLSFRLLKYIQREFNRIEIADDVLVEQRIPDLSYSHIQEDLFVKEILQQIDIILSKLPALTRRIYELRHIQNLSVKETAAALSISEGTVYNGYSQALSTVRRDLASLLEMSSSDKIKAALPFLLLIFGK